MKIIFRYLTLSVLMLCAIVMVPTSVYSKSDNPVTEIAYGVPITLAAIAQYVAYDQGFWEAEGLKVNLKFFSSGREAMDALLSKSVQLMSVSETPFVHTVLKGHKVVCVVTSAEHREAKLTVRKDRGILKPEDLRGKKLATHPGTNSDYYMYMFLKHYNIGLKDVKITAMKAPTMVTAFVGGDIDAFFAWEPHNFYAYSRMADKAFSFPTDKKLYEGRQTLNMNRDFVKANPDVVEKLIRGLISAEKYVAKDPEAAKKIVAKVMRIDIDVLKALWDEYKVKIQLDSGFLGILQKEARWALDIKGESDRPIPNMASFIYIDGLMAVRPESVAIELQ